MKKVIFLMGPTASGKTSLAMALARNYPIEIISVDSAMVYRGLNIGSGKPTPAQLKIAPHRLIDILDISESYSAARFCFEAKAHIQQIFDSGKIPLLVGGTMLYFKALQFGLSELPKQNLEIRSQLNEEAKKVGWSALHAKLGEIDERRANEIHPNDTQRIQRALEIYYATGLKPSDYYRQKAQPVAEYEIVPVALATPDRTVLHQVIEKRFNHMLASGLIEEVQTAFEQIDFSLPALRCVGYRQVLEYLLGHCDYNTMRLRAISATRQLAKRQLTWLRSWKKLIFLNTPSVLAFENLLKKTKSLFNFQD